MDYLLILEWIVKAVVILLFCVTGFAYLTFYERRALARIQVRIGPNRAGPSGWFQPVADGIKLIFKEEVIPGQAYKTVFILAPIVTVFPALVILAVIPWGTSITVTGLSAVRSARGIREPVTVTSPSNERSMACSMSAASSISFGISWK